MKKVVFMGGKTIGYECLSFLLSKKPFLDIEIVAVFTKENRLDDNSYSIKQLSQDNKTPFFSNIAELDNLNEIDFIISVQYHQILKAKQLAKAKDLAINLHMAPVPEYRGCNQFSFAILDEAIEFGTTLHKMDASIDGGDILFEKRFSIPENCWVKDLYELTYQHSLKLFKEKIGVILKGDYNAKPQSEYPNRKKGFHLRSEINEIKQIDLNWDKEKIERHIRATYFPPFEPPYFLIGTKKVYLSPDYLPQH